MVLVFCASHAIVGMGSSALYRHFLEIMGERLQMQNKYEMWLKNRQQPTGVRQEPSERWHNARKGWSSNLLDFVVLRRLVDELWRPSVFHHEGRHTTRLADAVELYLLT
jgi:hypothetical protein